MGAVRFGFSGFTGSRSTPIGGMTTNAGAHSELSVVAPCLNERDNLRELTDRVLKVFDERAIDGELVLVDDGSDDGTTERIGELAARHAPRVT
ncbi:MAG: glycosyltransferase, partial [Gemmatimonadota bacterium]